MFSGRRIQEIERYESEIAEAFTEPPKRSQYARPLSASAHRESNFATQNLRIAKQIITQSTHGGSKVAGASTQPQRANSRPRYHS